MYFVLRKLHPSVKEWHGLTNNGQGKKPFMVCGAFPSSSFLHRSLGLFVLIFVFFTWQELGFSGKEVKKM